MPRKRARIVSLVGARPQFIKIALLAEKLSSRFEHILVHSGQHYDRMMSDIFFKELAIPRPDYNLAVGSGNHGEMTARIMIRLEKLLLKLRPDMMLVYGDTNSTLAGALTAAKLHIPVGHIEAGLRSYRLDMPEEINRRLTDHISALLFCPTKQSIKNLKKEAVTDGIIYSGDLMYQLIDRYKKRITDNRMVLNRFGVEPKEYLLMTLHRAGTVDDKKKLACVMNILNRLEYPTIFPVHPRTRRNLLKFGLSKGLKKNPLIKLAAPLSYLDNLALIQNARAVLTDSGGVQKEAVYLKTPCLTLRDETEWTETLRLGNCLVGLDPDIIMAKLKRLSKARTAIDYKIGGRAPSDIICSSLSSFLRNL
jgi:UDP-GlcNAc3NAcA epimerase